MTLGGALRIRQTTSFFRRWASPSGTEKDRIVSLLRKSRSDPDILVKKDALAKANDIMEAIQTIDSHIYNIAAESGHESYSAWKGQIVSEADMIQAISALPSVALADFPKLRTSLEYLVKYSPYDSVKLAAWSALSRRD